MGKMNNALNVEVNEVTSKMNNSTLVNIDNTDTNTFDKYKIYKETNNITIPSGTTKIFFDDIINGIDENGEYDFKINGRYSRNGTSVILLTIALEQYYISNGVEVITQIEEGIINIGSGNENIYIPFPQVVEPYKLFNNQYIRLKIANVGSQAVNISNLKLRGTLI